MITQSDLMKLSLWARRNEARIVFELEGRYDLVVNRYIHAEDKTGRRVSWSEAFGSLPPGEVLARFKVKRVILFYKGSKKEMSVKDVKSIVKGL